jgi:PDZ domain-containing secreted protein
VIGATGKGFRRRGSIHVAAPELASLLEDREDALGGTMLIPDGEKQEVTVVISRPDLESSFGFGLGTTTVGDKVITKISIGGLAVGKLHVGDTVVNINGHATAPMEHAEALRHIVSSTRATLTVARVPGHHGLRRGGSIRQADPVQAAKVFQRRDSVGRAPGSHAEGQTDQVAVTITRPDKLSSFGFGLATLTTEAKVITKVSDGGRAVGKLQAGDTVLTVNGHTATPMQHAEVLQQITSSTTVELLVARNPAVPGGRQGSIRRVDPNTAAKVLKRQDSIGGVSPGSAGGPAVLHEVEQVTATIIRKDKSTSFGFGLGTTVHNTKIITKISENGLAVGKLQTGDVVLSINGLAAEPMAHTTALQHIVASTEVTLVVSRGETGDRRGSIQDADPSTASTVLKRRDSVGRGAVPQPEAGRQNVVSVVVKKSPEKGLGFSTAVRNGALVVTLVAPDGPAAGVLHALDTIITINGGGVSASSDEDVERLQSKLLSSVGVGDSAILTVRR